MNPALPPVIPTPARRRLWLFMKIAGIGLLIVFLHIPLAMTNGVLRERQSYQAQATEEIAETWGQSQQVTGPVLLVPWTQTRQRTVRKLISEGKYADAQEIYTITGLAYFLPAKLEVTAKIDPEIRYRGIYDSVVYAAKVQINGTFKPVELLPAEFHWSQARVHLGCTDLRRLRTAPALTSGGQSNSFSSDLKKEAGELVLTAPLASVVGGQEIAFAIELNLQGSKKLSISPIGKQTTIVVNSSWADPSFVGAQLPIQRSTGAEGFSARWELGPYGRSYPWTWTSGGVTASVILSQLGEGGFGVQLMQPVNGYSMAERAQKYGVLFFVLIFAVFFLFEITSGLRIHPLQYAMVGAALSLFFLGFLALTEFWTTAVAYGTTAAACTLLVSLYAWSFLQTGRRTLVIGGGLGATYGYLYFVLKSQDYALVAGTAALFAALALVMFCTRRLNWYAIDLPSTEKAEPVNQ